MFPLGGIDGISAIDGMTSDMFSMDLGRDIPREFTSILEHSTCHGEQRGPSPLSLQDTFELPPCVEAPRVEAPDFLSGDSASVLEQVSRNEIVESSCVGDTTPEDLFRLLSPHHSTNSSQQLAQQELLNCTIDHNDIPFAPHDARPRMDLRDHDGHPLMMPAPITPATANSRRGSTRNTMSEARATFNFRDGADASLRKRFQQISDRLHQIQMHSIVND